MDLARDEVMIPEGKRITQDVVDELLAAAEEARPAGRPSLSAPGVHSPPVTIRLPESLNAKLQHEAERTGKRRSVIIREALEAALR